MRKLKWIHIRKPSKRYLILFLLLIALFWGGRPGLHLLWTHLHDQHDAPSPAQGFLEDASRLDTVEIDHLWQPSLSSASPEEELADVLKHARAENRKVSIAGARHSMGGHTLYPGGIVVDMLKLNQMDYDPETHILWVQAGAKWEDILPYLHRYGRSIEVMQSNSSFTIGGSISVNCHGWQAGRPPIASTVKSFRLMLANGEIKECSREQNSELFSLALGGYGLLGIIIDVQVQTVPNQMLARTQYLVPTAEFPEKFQQLTQEDPEIQFMFGRMNISPDHLLEEVLLNVYTPSTLTEIPDLKDSEFRKLRRNVFRGSEANTYGKNLRWKAETQWEPRLNQGAVSRNQLLNEPSAVFQNFSAESTDVLHEYFIPPEQIGTFIQSLRELVLRDQPELLNVTIRHVEEDNDTFLRYADQAMTSFVLLFVQERSPEAETKMKKFSQALLDDVLAIGGRQYLPYRLHATPSQFRRAYPMADDFFKLKLKYDPEERFQNLFYLQYHPIP
ncbi:FAD-dependent oxidoreductase [Kiritimatiellota bacterium B12222]|nr:FAD-dependent oxidoreductase [Kiritimatiellota bacterium B12222]